MVRPHVIKVKSVSDLIFHHRDIKSIENEKQFFLKNQSFYLLGVSVANFFINIIIRRGRNL